MDEVAAYARLAGVYDELVVDPCYDVWASYLHERWSHDDHPVTSVLDVCCGTGLLAVELVERGYRVVGVDSSPEMLDRARILLGPAVTLLPRTLPDLDLDLDGVFDAAVSTFDGLNYLTPQDFTASLTAVAGALRPGGWFVFDLHTQAMLEFTVANPVVSGEEHGHRFQITSTIDATTRTCDTHVVMTTIDDGSSFTERHRQYFHTDDEVRVALRAAGFDDIEITDEYTARPADKSTLRATWCARR